MFSVGVDIGGSHIAAGVAKENGRLIDTVCVPYPDPARPEQSAAAISGLIARLLARCKIEISQIQSIGLAVPGSIDARRETVMDAHNLGYHQFPLKALLQQDFPATPIYLENDANAAALAEYYFGAFMGCASGLLLTIGTGIGGGLLLNHRLFSGGRKSGFEFGHGILCFGGEPCTCGNAGCIEAYCSAGALIRAGRQAMQSYPDSRINLCCGGNPDLVSAKTVIDCAKAGDAAALRVFDDYTAHLGAAVTTAIAMFDPEVIALGGGVSQAGAFLLEPIRAYAEKHAFFHDFGRIVEAKLGTDAGIIGAAMLARYAAAVR